MTANPARLSTADPLRASVCASFRTIHELSLLSRIAHDRLVRWVSMPSLHPLSDSDRTRLQEALSWPDPS